MLVAHGLVSAPAGKTDPRHQRDPDLDAKAPGFDDSEAAEDMPQDAMGKIAVVGLHDAPAAVDEELLMFRLDHVECGNDLAAF